MPVLKLLLLAFFWFHRPVGATLCTDYRQIWQGGAGSQHLTLFVFLFVTLTSVDAARRRTAFVDVGVSSVFIKRFSCSFLRFLEHEIALLIACINLKFVVSWRHNFGGNLRKFRKFLKISRKSLC